MKNKLRSKAGESLLESLVALAVVTMVISMLPAAVVTAARINHEARQQPVICTKDPALAVPSVSTRIKLVDNGIPTDVEYTYQGYFQEDFCYYTRPAS